MEDTTPKPGRDSFVGQLKGTFSRLPTLAGHVPPSEHVSHGERENEQLAILIGQFQHLLDLALLVAGRPHYLPLIATLDGATSDELYLPAEAHTIDGIQISTDTAFVLTLALLDPHQPGGTVQIGRVVVNLGISDWIPINAPVPPSSCQLLLTASQAPVHASVHILLKPQLPGGYPYAG